MRCEICGREFIPNPARPFGRQVVTCGRDACQRAQKTRLQKQRRAEEKRDAQRTAQMVSVVFRTKTGETLGLTNEETLTTKEIVTTRRADSMLLSIGPGIKINVRSRPGRDDARVPLLEIFRA